MDRYVNRGIAAVDSVEITRHGGGIQACIGLRDEAARKKIEPELTALGFQIIGHTHLRHKPMLIVTGTQSESALLSHLSGKGGALEPEKNTHFDAWKVRSFLGFGGQILQLISSLMRHKVDRPLLVFSTANLAANSINLAYKAQKRDDPHQLHALKQIINEQLSHQLAPDATLLDVNDQRAHLREHVKTRTPNALNEFMRKHSVSVGELGLRYIGALNLAFDFKRPLQVNGLPHWNPNPLRTATGVGSIIGKTLATTSLIPDPYNPKKPSGLDTLREKYSFLAGGLIEAGSFSILAYDAFANSSPMGADKSRCLKVGGKYYRDWLSGIGAAMFVGGYIARSWAKYGERHVNMDELYAHASDTIALLPADKIPQALADTSAFLADHFKDKKDLSFGIIYNKIKEDLAREHHLSVAPAFQAKAVSPEASLTHTANHFTNRLAQSTEHSVQQHAI